MKICVIAPTVIPILGKKQRYGGIELVIALGVDELVARGHEVFLFASGDSITSAKLIPIIARAIGQGGSYDQEKRLNRLAYRRAIAKKPDIIWDHTYALHAHVDDKNALVQEDKFNWQVKVSIDPARLINTNGIPVIQTIHSQAKDHLPKIVKSLSKAGHFLVTISHDQARRFAPYFSPKQHLGTIYNAVDIRLYKVGKHQKSNYLVWLGRYGMEKGAHIALAVAHELKIPIKLIGKRAEEHEQKYFEKFIKPNLLPQDKEYPEITTTQKAKLLCGAKATLMTNLWPEPFGLVAIESMAAGTPVIGPSFGALTEIIDGLGVLVPIDDLGINEHADNITPTHEKYIKRIVHYAPNAFVIPPYLIRDRVEKLFSIKQNVDGYEQSFAKALYIKGKSDSGLRE